MTKLICVTGGKGGVGKTTTAVNLASSLQKLGSDSLLVDANISTPNVHHHLGAMGINRNLHHAIDGHTHISQVVYKHHSGLRLVPTVTELEQLKFPDYHGLRDALLDLHDTADIVVIDSAAGLGQEAVIPMEVADEILIVTTPDHSSVHHAKQTLEVARELGKQVIGVVLNKVRKDKLEHTVEEVEAELGVPVIAIVPHDTKVRSAWSKKHPVVHAHPKSSSSKQFYKLAELLLGKGYVKTLKKQKDGNIESYVLKNLGMK